VICPLYDLPDGARADAGEDLRRRREDDDDDDDDD
jgi:hypothetical protein